MNRRRSLTPPTGQPTPGLPPTRRGGARRETAERVHFIQGDRELSGWALNTSRGGLRAIVEDPIDLGETFQITVGDDDRRRAGKVVWIQEEPDGFIVGVSFLDDPGSAPPPPPES